MGDVWVVNKADLPGAELIGTILDGACLKGANLTKASLSKASLRGTNLTGANLQNVNNLTCKQIESAVFDQTVVFPDYLKVTWISEKKWKCTDRKKGINEK